MRHEGISRYSTAAAFAEDLESRGHVSLTNRIRNRLPFGTSKRSKNPVDEKMCREFQAELLKIQIEEAMRGSSATRGGSLR